jgi:7-cyano-7-deazaguanine synthase in queuosine biosynthesis
MLEVAEQEGFKDLLYYTWTCWYPINDEPCGECHMCKERIIECKEISDE